jgi:hypothetical protein
LQVNKSPADTPPHQGNIALDVRLRIGLRRIAHVARSIPLAWHPVIRLPWFQLKRALRICTGSDRMYLVEEFVHRLKAGSIGSQCHITAERGDGAGAQAQAKMSASVSLGRMALPTCTNHSEESSMPRGPPTNGLLRGRECSI